MIKPVIIFTFLRNLNPDAATIFSQEKQDEKSKLLIFNDVVIGPAMDGGFYFLGVKTLNGLHFQNIIWSSSGVLAQYMENLSSEGHTIKLLETLEDIDDELSYNRFMNTVN